MRPTRTPATSARLVEPFPTRSTPGENHGSTMTMPSGARWLRNRRSAASDARTGPQIANGAEETGHHIIALRHVEGAHVALEELRGRNLPPSDRQERWVDVEPVHDEAVIPQVLYVLTRSTADVQHRSRGRPIGPNQLCDDIGFRGVVLKGAVDGVVQLCGFREHR